MSGIDSADRQDSKTREVFSLFEEQLVSRPPLRAAIVSSCRRPEETCLIPLLDLAALAPAAAERVAKTARELVEDLRGRGRKGGVEELIQEYDLSSQEGVALMCLAEALLRIPDNATRDSFIREKIATGNWRSHIGHSPSIFVNAATWGLVITGKLTDATSGSGLRSALTRLIGRGGEPLIRKGTDLAVRMMGEQFVAGQTIRDALVNSRRLEARGFQYSYDMLGEAAMTARDAARYLTSYEQAIHSIGQAAKGRGTYDGPGISIKLSALHPRYTRIKRARIIAELIPRVKSLALLAKSYDIGMNIDAEEADRLDLSLDVLEALSVDGTLDGWNGIGFVIQAYGKRCLAVVDFLIDLAHRTKRRLMVRLVKGAYWDSEIKRAQVDGLESFPVFTRKVHTDVSYLACARRLLDAPDAVFPQFATHNAQTLATIIEMAGPNFHPGQYEFQCLHGMGEALYESVVARNGLNRPCRIYAPVGTHETLLAYLVRRLLENGANTSFVNRIADDAVPVEDLIADPVELVRSSPRPGTPHEKIALPRDLYGSERPNAAGLDLDDEAVLARLADDLRFGADQPWVAFPTDAEASSDMRSVRNPADHQDLVGKVRYATADDVETSLAKAEGSLPFWAGRSARMRARCLRRAADLMEGRMPLLLGLIVREAGKSFANAVSEVREAVDFLRYYAWQAERTLGETVDTALGPVVCISPWNFPLAIFTGQVAAALAAGNTVLAKPAEETPLIAAEAVRILIEAGVPAEVLRYLPGAGDIGAALVADARVRGVMFTGSTVVARHIQRQLAQRLTPDGLPVPLIAETGGQNALVVDSSALPEQVVADVISSAFDSAGQRCSALRILCLQEDIAERTLMMLKGALKELEVGDTRRLSVDVGPVISQEAAETIGGHIASMRAAGHGIEQARLTAMTGGGTFIAPTIIEIGQIPDLKHEVFGPVLHVVRFRRGDLGRLIQDINETGYALTFGAHTRLDETIALVSARVAAGNIYINRNIIGAVVGVQPFGGSGLSGTGPKAGGPLYLRRLSSRKPSSEALGLPTPHNTLPIARSYVDWLRKKGRLAEADQVSDYMTRSMLGLKLDLRGPVGEQNVYALHPRGEIGVSSTTDAGLLTQVGAILATGNKAIVASGARGLAILADLPSDVVAKVVVTDRPARAPHIRAMLHEGDAESCRELNMEVAERSGAIIPIQTVMQHRLGEGMDYDLLGLLEERSISINTAAAGGNASLMSIG